MIVGGGRRVPPLADCRIIDAASSVISALLDSATDLPPPRPSLKKFGAFVELIGLRLVEWELDRCVIELDLEPRHLNGFGVVHGGVLATLLDTACAHCGIYCTVPGNRRLGATVSFTMNLIGNAKGGRLVCVARKRGGGKTLFMAQAEIVDLGGNLLATAEAVGRYQRGSHRPEGVTAHQPANT